MAKFNSSNSSEASRVIDITHQPNSNNNEWYDSNLINDLLCSYLDDQIEILYSLNTFDTLNQALENLDQNKSKFIIPLNVRCTDGGLEQNSNHWVALYITRNHAGLTIAYLDPMGRKINKDLKDNLDNYTADEITEPLFSRGIQFTKGSNELEIKGNINDCGPMLIYAIICYYCGRPLPKIKNESESNALGQYLRNAFLEKMGFDEIYNKTYPHDTDDCDDDEYHWLESSKQKSKATEDTSTNRKSLAGLVKKFREKHSEQPKKKVKFFNSDNADHDTKIDIETSSQSDRADQKLIKNLNSLIRGIKVDELDQDSFIQVIKNVGDVCEKLSWNEENPNIIRNKHGHRNRYKGHSNKKNTKGAQINFENLQHLKEIDPASIGLILQKNKQEIQDSLQILSKKLDIIEVDKKEESNTADQPHFLNSIAAYFHDKVCLTKIITLLETINDFKLNNSAIQRYYLGYSFCQIGELSKEISDFIKPEFSTKNGQKNIIRFFFSKLAQYRQEIKNSPYIVYDQNNSQLEQLLIFLQSAIKHGLIDLLKKIQTELILSSWENGAFKADSIYIHNKQKEKYDKFLNKDLNLEFLKQICIFSLIKCNDIEAEETKIRENIASLEGRINELENTTTPSSSSTNGSNINRKLINSIAEDIKKIKEKLYIFVNLTDKQKSDFETQHKDSHDRLAKFSNEYEKEDLKPKIKKKKKTTINEQAFEKLYQMLCKTASENLKFLDEHTDNYLKSQNNDDLTSKLNDYKAETLTFRTLEEYINDIQIQPKNTTIPGIIKEQKKDMEERLKQEKQKLDLIENELKAKLVNKSKNLSSNNGDLQTSEKFVKKLKIVITEIENLIKFANDKRQQEYYDYASKMCFGFIGQHYKELNKDFNQLYKMNIFTNSYLHRDNFIITLIRHKQILHNLHNVDKVQIQREIEENIVPWLDDFKYMSIINSDKIDYNSLPQDNRLFTKYTSLSKADKEIYIHYTKIVALNRFLRIDEALYLCDSLLKKPPKNAELKAEIYWQKSLAYRNLSDFNSCLSALEKAIECIDNDANSEINNFKIASYTSDKAICYIELDKYGEADKLLQDITTNFKTGITDYIKINANILRASIEMSIGDEDFAMCFLEKIYVKHHEAIMAINPSRMLTLLSLLASGYASANNIKAVKQCINEINSLRQDTVYYTTNFGQFAIYYDVVIQANLLQYNLYRYIVNQEQNLVEEINQSIEEYDLNTKSIKYLEKHDFLIFKNLANILLSQQLQETEISQYNVQNTEFSSINKYIRELKDKINQFYKSRPKNEHQQSIKELNFKRDLDSTNDKIFSILFQNTLIEYKKGNISQAQELAKQSILAKLLKNFLQFEYNKITLQPPQELNKWLSDGTFKASEVQSYLQQLLTDDNFGHSINNHEPSIIEIYQQARENDNIPELQQNQETKFFKSLGIVKNMYEMQFQNIGDQMIIRSWKGLPDRPKCVLSKTKFYNPKEHINKDTTKIIIELANPKQKLYHINLCLKKFNNTELIANLSNNIKELYFDQEDYKNATLNYQLLIDVINENKLDISIVPLLYNKARAYHKNGEIEEAASHYRAVLERNPSHKKSQDHLESITKQIQEPELTQANTPPNEEMPLTEFREGYIQNDVSISSNSPQKTSETQIMGIDNTDTDL